MKIKIPNIDFISFNDGVCDIYFENDEEEKVYKYRSIGLSNKVLGLKRYYTAKASQVEIDAVITIPNIPGIDNRDIVVINGVGRYRIELMQPKYDTNPLSIDLTLKQLEIFGGI